MNLTLEILVLGGPFLLSLAWFAFWVIKILRTAKKLKKAPPGSAGSAGSAGSGEAPASRGPSVHGGSSSADRDSHLPPS